MLTEIFEDEIEPLVAVDDVHEFDDGSMIEFLEQGYLSNGRRWHAFNVSVKTNLFQGNRLT